MDYVGCVNVCICFENITEKWTEYNRDQMVTLIVQDEGGIVQCHILSSVHWLRLPLSYPIDFLRQQHKSHFSHSDFLAIWRILSTSHCRKWVKELSFISYTQSEIYRFPSSMWSFVSFFGTLFIAHIVRLQIDISKEHRNKQTKKKHSMRQKKSSCSARCATCERKTK